MLKYYVKYQAWLAGARHKAQSGQSLAEYGLILALIAVVCITALSTIGTNLNNKLTCLAGALAVGNKANKTC